MIKEPVLDVTFIAVLFLLSLFMISFYFGAHFINPGYADWIVHAFRIKLLDSYGFVSWTHTWSNGISIWKAYQFLPHYLTLGLSKILSTDIPSTMVIMTTLLFIIIRFFIYLSLRALNITPLSAFLSTILSYDIAQYWGGVADYSLLFGFTFFPLSILLWVKYTEGKFQYLFPYLVGLSFYIHIILGLASTLLLFIGLILSRQKLFTPQKVTQGLILLASSSLFWVPIIFKTSYTYSSSVYANRYFLNLAISPYSYYGLSIFIIAAIVISTISIFSSQTRKKTYLKCLLAFVIFYFGLVVIGSSVDLPRFISQLQFSRGTTYIGIATIFVFASVIERLNNLKSRILKGGLLFILSLSLIEGMWFTSIYSPHPQKDYQDPIQSYSQKNNLDLSSNRIWSPRIDLSSYFAPLNYRYPDSYMNHLGSNLVSQRVSQVALSQPLMDELPQSTLERINDYFKITGVKYAFFDEISPFTKTLTDSPEPLKTTSSSYKNLGPIELKDSMYHAFELPWEPRDAVLLNESNKNKLKQFPHNLEVSNTDDQSKLDILVKDFNQAIFATDNTTLDIHYPHPEIIEVQIPEIRTQKTLYIDESYDQNWTAYFNNRKQSISPIGPNFMLVNLDSELGGGKLILKHHWPLTFYISVYLILLIPMEFLLIKLVKKYAPN